MTARVSNPMFESGFVLGKRYRLDEPLASGGMAEVWKGHDTILQRAVALKLLHPHLANDPTIVERFRREAIAAARLAHPNIVPTFDTGAEDNVAFIVMGLINGPTLREVIDSEGKLPVSRVASLGRQIADALDHAHARKIVHRDVKPANVLLVDGSRVMVTDFGIAKAVEEAAEVSLTMPGLVVATPGYSAPEQLAGRETDARTDVYALGVLLHELACGHTGIESPTAQMSADEFGTSDFACPTLDPALLPVVSKATAPNPDERFQSAADLRDELSTLERTNPTKVTEPDTPASGTPEVPKPKPQPTITMAARPRPAPVPTTSGARRRRIITVAVVLVLVLAAAAVGRFVGGIGKGTPSETPSQQAQQPLAGLTAKSYDPFGSNQTEHESEAPLAVDGNGSSAWSTETYADSKMGKRGVGIVINAGSAAPLKNLVVQSRAQGWAASVYVANGAPTAFDSWGDPVDTQSGLGSTATFDLHARTGDSVLLWLTDLGQAKQFSATEIQVIR